VVVNSSILHAQLRRDMSITKPVETFILQQGFSQIQNSPLGVLNLHHVQDFTY